MVKKTVELSLNNRTINQIGLEMVLFPVVIFKNALANKLFKHFKGGQI